MTEIVERLRNILSIDFPETNLVSDDEILNEDILDSLIITKIISTLTIEFGIKIPYEEITKENFSSINNILKMIDKIKENE